MWKALNILQALPVIAAMALSVACLSGCASLEEEIDHFQFAALSPVRDVNLLQQEIPQQLTYLSHPYGQVSQSGCGVWASEIQQLEQAIIANDGRRPGFRRDPNTFVGRTGNLRDAGVRALTRSVLPFRGVVRQVSGAAKLEQNADQASDRARYRIGYLVGLARANNCPGFAEGPVRHAPALSPYSPAAVRQSYPTLGTQIIRTQTVQTQPYARHQIQPVRIMPPAHPQTHDTVPAEPRYQTPYPAPTMPWPAQQVEPRTVYPDRASRGRLRSSRR